MCLLLSCNIEYGESYNVYIHPSFSSENIANIQEAEFDWTDQVGVNFHTIIGECNMDGDYNICIIPTTDAQLSAITEENGWADGTIGVTRTNALQKTHANSKIYLSIDNYSSDDYYLFRTMTEHELGHALGLKHVSNENALMFPANNGNPITCDDVSQYGNLRGIVIDCPKKY
jgi:predicted Zn-dependent protease